MTPTLSVPEKQQLTALKRIHARARNDFKEVLDRCRNAIDYAEENGHTAATAEWIARKALEFFNYADAQIERQKEDFMEKRGKGLEEWME